MVRPDVGVVEESWKEPSLQVLLEKGLKGAKAQVAFEGFPKSFDEGDGADFADGSEAMPHVKSGKKFPEPRIGELGTLVGDEVTRRAEPATSGSKEFLDLGRRRFCGKDAGGERHSGEGVEYDGDLEMEEAEEAWDVGQIGQPDMVGIVSADGPAGRRWGSGRSWRRIFLSNASDSLSRKLPAGAGESLRDELVTTKAGEGHGLDQVADHIGIASNGRLGTHERVVGLRLGESCLVPAGDGVGGNGKEPCGFSVGKCQEVADAEDAEALLGRVVRAPAFRKSLPALRQDGSGLMIDACVKSLFLGPGKANLKRLRGVPHLGESETGGITEKLGGFSQGAKGKDVKAAILGKREEDPFRMRGRHGRFPCGWGCE